MERGRGSVATFPKALSALNVVLCDRNAASLTLAEVIQILRKRRGISQRELACLAQVSQPTIGTLERIGTGPLAPFARVLNSLGAGAYLAPASQPRAFYAQAGHSSIGQAWETPSDLLEVLYEVFGKFDLDPCSSRKNGPVKARVRFTAVDDGLSVSWNGRVFMNPPYGRSLGAWVAKAKNESKAGNARLVVLLIPARTETNYGHLHIAGRAVVWFLKGRLRFGGGKQSAPFPSALACYGASPGEIEVLDRMALGWKST